MILYLDFDGVLHPDEVYLVNGRPTIQGEYAHLKLFCWAPILEGILALHPNVQIVLSTSWVRVLGFQRAKKFLPPSLQQRVIGATYHSHFEREDLVFGLENTRIPWGMLTRYEQIARHVMRHGPSSWLAIDNDTFGWPDELRANLVETHDDYGLGHPDAQQDLKDKLFYSWAY